MDNASSCSQKAKEEEDRAAATGSTADNRESVMRKLRGDEHARSRWVISGRSFF